MYAVCLLHFSRILNVCNPCDIAACCNEQVQYILHEKDVLSESPIYLQYYQ
jgi:hypothetical protein